MAKVTTMPAYLWPLMDGCTVRLPFCAVCGRTRPLNQHHVVRRSAGQLVRGGIVVPKPTLTLCGSGNTGGCHGAAHDGRLHFRWVKAPTGDWRYFKTVADGGHWEYLRTDEPCRYAEALEIDGWREIAGGVPCCGS